MFPGLVCSMLTRWSGDKLYWSYSFVLVCWCLDKGYPRLELSRLMVHDTMYLRVLFHPLHYSVLGGSDYWIPTYRCEILLCRHRQTSSECCHLSAYITHGLKEGTTAWFSFYPTDLDWYHQLPGYHVMGSIILVIIVASRSIFLRYPSLVPVVLPDGK